MSSKGAHDNESLISKQLADEPIILPGSPILEIFKDFGRDELIALLINTLGVGVLSGVTNNAVLLALVGPVIEKIGFFANSSKNAFDVYRTTPPAERNPRSTYFLEAVKNGLPNLARDLVLHDPLYTALMLLELKQLPETPVWMLSVIAFLVAIGAVASGEVLTKEALYKLQVGSLQRRGFSLEKHLEAKFILQNTDSQDVLGELAEYFQLGDVHTSAYHDTYYETRLKTYNSRTPIVRVRRRTEDDQTAEPDAIQVVYTRAAQLRKSQPEQFNFYPVAKDKLQLELTQKTEQDLRRLVRGNETHEVFFDRDYANIPGELLITADQVHSGSKPYVVVEVKSVRDEKDAVRTMIMAMRHIMSKYDVVQTTHSKRVLTSLR
jgi:hypothetical protein